MGAAPLCLSLLSKLPMERVVASEAPAPLQRAARRAAPAGGRRGVLWLAVLADALMRFKPSEPFLVPYLADATRLGNDAVAARILVVYSYAAFAAAVALPALAALLPALRYKHLLVLCGAARLGTRALLLAAPQSVPLMQLMQVLYGVAECAGVVNLCYLYRALPLGDFAIATGAATAAERLAYMVAAEAGQAAVSSGWLGGSEDKGEGEGGSHDAAFYRPLFWASGVAVSVAMALTCALPVDTPDKDAAHRRGVRQWLKLLRSLYASPLARFLSAWLALALAAEAAAENFSTTVLCAADPGGCETQAGHLAAAARAAAAVAALLAARAARWLGERPKALVAVLTGGLAGMGGLMLLASASASLAEFAVPYAATVSAASALQCVAFALVAREVAGVGDYVVLFGANSAASLGLSAALTFFAEGVASLAPRPLYAAFGLFCLCGTMLALAVAFQERHGLLTPNSVYAGLDEADEAAEAAPGESEACLGDDEIEAAR